MRSSLRGGTKVRRELVLEVDSTVPTRGAFVFEEYGCSALSDLGHSSCLTPIRCRQNNNLSETFERVRSSVSVSPPLASRDPFQYRGPFCGVVAPEKGVAAC